MEDMVNEPPHYTYGSIECIELMEEMEGTEAVMNFCKCNAIKYIFRSKHKDNEKQDIEKAIWYLNKWLELNDMQKPEVHRQINPVKSFERMVKEVCNMDVSYHDDKGEVIDCTKGVLDSAHVF